MPEFIPQHTPADLDEFVSGYLACAEWLIPENDDGDTPCADGFAPSAVEKAKVDCAEFIKRAGGLYTNAVDAYGAGRAGHDFWLTRNGHGAGFWDRGLGKLGDDLTTIANTFSEVNPFVNDDFLIYIE